MGTYIKNLRLFLAVAEDEEIDRKIENIKRHLRDGADVNAKDANDKNNTPLHIAVLRNEPEIVSLLLKMEEIDVFSSNADAETPLDIAKKLIKTNGAEVFNLLDAHSEQKTRSTKEEKLVDEISSSLATIALESASVESTSSCRKHDKNEENYENYYPKGKETSGISGQLYESKLLCLVYLRARYNVLGLEYFYLGTNRSQIGALDDLYIKYKFKKSEKAKIIFLQAKHVLDPTQGTITIDSLRTANGNYSLAKYFRSYLNIKNTFGKKSPIVDVVFKECFGNEELMFVIYTCSKHDIKPSKLKPVSQTSMKKEDYNFIITGECKDIFQIVPDDDDINILTKVTLDERIKNLGKALLKFIIPGSNTSNMMSDDLIKSYHVLLAAQVIEVSKTVKNGDNRKYRSARFRQKFFSSRDEPLVILKEAMYGLIISKYNKKRSITNKDAQIQLTKLIDRPSAESISKLIGNMISFNEKNNKLMFIEKDIPLDLQHFREKLKKIRVAESVIKEAIEIESKKRLGLIEFTVPESFGNFDLTLQESEINRRIPLLALNVTKLLNNYQTTKYVININDTMVGPKNVLTSGVIDIKGGIGGAVGNLLVMDEKSKLIKLNTNHKSLPKYAKVLLRNIENNMSKEKNLNKYRFNIDLKGFPRLSWGATESDKKDAEYFYSKLYFCTTQAQENEIEGMLKIIINELYRAGKHLEHENIKTFESLRIHSDAIYLKFHDEIQKWWMLQNKAQYLTNSSNIFVDATKYVIISPLLTVLNFMYLNEINKADIKFNEDAILQLELDSLNNEILIIISNAILLSAIKLKQYFKDFNISFLDLDYVLKLPSNNYETLITELKENDLDVLIIAYEDGQNSEYLNHISNILKKKIVIITNIHTAKQLKQNHTRYQIKTDNRNSLAEFETASQDKILERPIIFQGHELQLDELIDDDSKHLIKERLICKMINNDGIITVGNSLKTSKYKKIFDYYIDRTLTRGHRSYPVKTLKDIHNKFIIITATAGMGKSTLLSHLLVETKKQCPSFCAILINLSDYSKDFFKWKSEKPTDLNVKLDITKIIKLIFIAGLNIANSMRTNDANDEESQFNFELVETDGKLSLLSFSNISEYTLLELELFIEFFNKGKLTFLFDGFDEICPTYYKEVKQLLEILHLHPIKNCIWVTSRSYNKIVSDLERTFGRSYTLEPFSTSAQKIYLEKYWKTHLKISKINQNEINCISKFIEYMSQFAMSKGKKHFPYIKLRSVPLHTAYTAAIDYFKKEIDSITIDIDKEELRKKWDIDTTSPMVFNRIGSTPSAMEEANELAGTPLHLCIVADYFSNQIKIKAADPNELEFNWNLEMNTYTLYEYFIETKIKKICYAEKDNTDIYLSAVELKYQRELKEFKDLHAKLALLTFYDKDLLYEFLNLQITEELKRIIEGIDTGIEKRGFIDSVIDGVPKFIHIIFAEYFAVEYVCDLLKSILSTEGNWREVYLVIHFVMNFFLFQGFTGLRNVFDYKLESDTLFRDLMSKNECREIVFNLLLFQFQCLCKTANDNGSNISCVDTVLTIAHDEGLLNIVDYLLKCVKDNVNKDNVEWFIRLIRHSSFINSAVSTGRVQEVNYLLDCIRNADVDLFNEILSNGYFTGFRIDRSILHDNSAIISTIHSGLQSAIDNLAMHFALSNVPDDQKDDIDIAIVSRHFSPEEGPKTYCASILAEMKIYFNKKQKT